MTPSVEETWIKGRDMNCVQCCVRRAPQGGWDAQIGTENRGPYDTRDLALQVAVANALSIRRAGGGVRVIVKDANGGTQAERCLCEAFGR
jgi:hypothetical protein